MNVGLESQEGYKGSTLKGIIFRLTTSPLATTTIDWLKRYGVTRYVLMRQLEFGSMFMRRRHRGVRLISQPAGKSMPPMG